MDAHEDDVSLEQFRAIFTSARSSRTETVGRASTLEEQRVRATQLVSSGTTISCAWPIQTASGPDNTRPAVHLMTQLPSPPSGAERVGVAADYLAIECHGDSQSHIDALCHVAWEGQNFSGHDASEVVDVDGAREGGLELAVHGIVGRGVLLDLPLSAGVDWLEPGHRVTVDELIEAERRLGNPVGEGDVVLIRTGHDRRRRALGPWPSASHKAGLDVHAMPWLGSKGVVALGFDGDGEVMPHTVEDVAYPIHVLGIVAMGLYFLDSLDLQALSDYCARVRRWEFLFVVAPLHLVGGTGSPINPIAVL